MRTAALKNCRLVARYRAQPALKWEWERKALVMKSGRGVPSGGLTGLPVATGEVGRVDGAKRRIAGKDWIMRTILKVLSVGLVLGMPALAIAAPKPMPSPPRPVPELSVGGAGAALALLVGGALMLSERRRRETSK